MKSLSKYQTKRETENTNIRQIVDTQIDRQIQIDIDRYVLYENRYRYILDGQMQIDMDRYILDKYRYIHTRQIVKLKIEIDKQTSKVVIETIIDRQTDRRNIQIHNRYIRIRTG